MGFVDKYRQGWDRCGTSRPSLRMWFAGRPAAPFHKGSVAERRDGKVYRDDAEGHALHTQTELALTRQSEVGFQSGLGQTGLGFAAPIAAILVLALSLAAALAAAPLQDNSTRLVLASVSSVKSAVRPHVSGLALPSDGSAPDAVTDRRLNAVIPFSDDELVAAPPFLFAGSFSSRARAVDCLALASMAEAGASDVGQRAVIQVILNRVRHPAFAKSVCGVVFQGSHRSTGCQFTFTCDGSLARRYSPVAWSRARARAAEALDGRVYAGVGPATHYHTDWVHPYWSDTLVKIARVDTHLFFRWPGQLGLGAPGSVYRGDEPAIAQLAYLPDHSDGTYLAQPVSAASFDGSADYALTETIVHNGDGGAFVRLSGSQSAASAKERGRSICAGRSSCKVFGWFEGVSLPAGYPVSTLHRATLAFSYFRGTRDEEIVLFDCSRFSDVLAASCLPKSRPGRQTAQPTSAEEIAKTSGIHPPGALPEEEPGSTGNVKSR